MQITLQYQSEALGVGNNEVFTKLTENQMYKSGNHSFTQDP
jgi:hypothetical protein